MKKISMSIVLIGLFSNFSGLYSSAWDRAQQVAQGAYVAVKLPYNLKQLYDFTESPQRLENSLHANKAGYFELAVQKGDLAQKAQREKSVLLLSAVEGGKDAKIVQLLLDAGADPNFMYYPGHGDPLIFKAIDSGNVETIKALLQAGANPNAFDVVWVPLTYVLGCKLEDEKTFAIMKLLLENGANINLVMPNGQTVLTDFMLYEKNIAFLKLLLNFGADVNLATDVGITPLMFAASRNNLKAVKLLLSAGALVNVANNDRITALMVAAGPQIGRIDVVKLLLKSGANIDVVDNNGQTVFDYAISNQEIRKYLQKYRALPIVKINKRIDQEPKPENYVLQDYDVIDESGDGNEDLERQVADFERDHMNYWRDKLQVAYRDFLEENNPVLLRNFFVQQLYPRLGLLPEIISFFRSKSDFVSVIEQLKVGATTEEIAKLQKIIKGEQHVAAGQIQGAFKKRQAKRVVKSN